MKSTVYIQKVLIAVNVIQIMLLASSYLRGSYLNSYPVFESMFKPELVNTCTSSGCWQAIVPFLGSAYISLALIFILALFFRAGRELRLMLVGLAFIHIFMATIRLMLVPSEIYLEGVSLGASTFQYLFGLILLVSSVLPYPDEGKM